MTSDISGWVVEIFGSVQGEGVHVGRRHLFVRLAGCGFGCRYCDQPEAEEAPPKARIETASGSGCFREEANPLEAAAVADRAVALDTPRGLHHAVSVTGGEPLEQPAFAAALLRRLKEIGFRTLLETNGIHPKRLEALLPWVDIVSMDYKIASSSGRPVPADRHRRFLEKAREKELCVKVVVSDDSTPEEVEAAASAVAAIDRDIPLVIQPEWVRRPDSSALLRYHEAASSRLRDVRVIAQMHRALGMR